MQRLSTASGPLGPRTEWRLQTWVSGVFATGTGIESVGGVKYGSGRYPVQPALTLPTSSARLHAPNRTRFHPSFERS